MDDLALQAGQFRVVVLSMARKTVRIPRHLYVVRFKVGRVISLGSAFQKYRA